MITADGLAEILRECADLKAAADSSYTWEVRALRLDRVARHVPILVAEIERLRGLLEEVYPQHYGLLLELWGSPDQWPTYGAAGVELHRKLRGELGYPEEAK